MKLKGRYIPDDKIEIAPYIVDIPRGEGMTQLVVLDPKEKEQKEIQCFQWDWPEPPKKDKTWVIGSVMAASIVGIAATLAIFFVPNVAVPTICACLGWLGIVAFANR